MGPLGHTVISTALGAAVWGATGSPVAGAAAVATGVLIDLDHLIDFSQWYFLGRKKRLFLFGHAWEYSVVGILVLLSVFYHPVLLGVVAGHFGHVATDHLRNGLTSFAYFITYRAKVGFDAGVLAPGYDVRDSFRSWPKLLPAPIGRRIDPWYRRKIVPWFESRINS